MATEFYFDDSEGEGLSRATSHPNFTKHFTAEFYYDCVDDEAPFGCDGGSDMLDSLEDQFRAHGPPSDILGWLFEEFDRYGFSTRSRGVAEVSDKAELAVIDAKDEFVMNELDEAIIATAFGQIKISGWIDPQLKKLAMIALKRRQDRFGDFGRVEGEITAFDQMSRDLSAFPT